jgi:membrane dipeptidase
MATLEWVDHRDDPGAWAAALGVSVEACELLLDADFIDLHMDTEVPARLYGYDPSVRHAPKLVPSRFFGHSDYPRMLESGLTGVVYDIATNPIRPARNRQAVTLANLDRAKARIATHSEHMVHVRTRADYAAARAADKMAMWISLQGGNALIHDPTELDRIGVDLHRITLVHLTTSGLGGTNSPLGGDIGLTPGGAAFVEACVANRVLVDLAHSGKKTFWGALDVHGDSQPPIVSHTGVEAVRPHWRNVDDDQIKAIADRGGVVGVMYQSAFLADVWAWGRAKRVSIVDHLEHICDLVGDEFAAIGTDYDGAIVPPSDLPDLTHHPLLVQDMLDRGFGEDRIRNILGRSYLRVVGDVRA